MDSPFDKSPVSRQSFAFADLTMQDKWITTWAPVRTSWTDVGTPTVSARHKVIGKQCHFQMKVVPSTSIATTAGTSYTDLPVLAKGYGGVAIMVNATTNVAVGDCVFDTTNSRLYVPTQAASGNTFVIAGSYEV